MSPLVILVGNKLSCYVLHFYQVYCEGYSSYKADTKSNSNTREITPKESQSCHSCMQHVIWSCSTFLPFIIKIFGRVFVLQSRHKIKLKHKKKTPKVRKPKLSFLYVTRRLVLFYISTKYHENIPKGIRLTGRTQNQCIISVK